MGSCRLDVILLNWRFRICDRVNLRALWMGLLLQFVKESSGKLRAAVSFEIGLGLNAESFRSTEDISECLLIIASSVLFLQNWPVSESNILRLQLPFALAVAAKSFLSSAVR